MLWIKWLLLAVALGSLAGGLARLVYDTHRLVRRREPLSFPPSRLYALIPMGLVAFALAQAIVVVPSGMAGVRVSQVSGVRPGTLFPGTHVVRPLVESVVLYDTRDRMLSTEAAHAFGSKEARPIEVLTAQSREGLSVGLAVSVRYRLEPKRLDHIHGSLPHPIERELVPPVVASAFRQVVPAYMVREVFATQRETVRQTAAEIITAKLAEDGIVVKEVMLRDVVLPLEYAKGLEGLLLKEQENERMTYDIQIKEKQVRSATLEAEAEKAREVKKAEASAAVTVLGAKAQADAMQHTLPLKEKQIQQSRLEAEARKESTLKNAEAAAGAKLIDARAEKERMGLIADADANRIRIIAAADAERLGQEGAVLSQNPLLIQKIVAERLSDKMQIMMVPMDGKDFFATDVFRTASLFGAGARPAAVSPAPSAPQEPAQTQTADSGRDRKRRVAQRR
jgi:regulator of protease activity HflC (stomatin/prohibitin superfamily)